MLTLSQASIASVLVCSPSGQVACYGVATVLPNVENEVCHPFREIQAACRERRVARDIAPQCLMLWFTAALEGEMNGWGRQTQMEGL